MFKNLKISVKLLSSGVVFVVPISVILYFVLFAFDKDINKANDELNGNKALGNIVGLTNDIIEYQNLILLRNTDSTLFNKISGDENLLEIRKVIDSSFDLFISNTKIYATKISQISSIESSNITQIIEPRNLKELWNNEISTQMGKDSVDNVPFKTFYGGAQGLIKLISNESGLILDPDIDSYYLMDISVLVLPKLQIMIGEVLEIIQNSYLSGSIGDFEVNKVRLILDVIEGDYINRIRQGVFTSILEDNHYYGESISLKRNAPKILNKFSVDLDDFISIAKKWYSGDSTNESQIISEVKYKGYRALNSNVDFWIGINSELDILLNKRIDHFKHLRTIALVSSGIAIAIDRKSVV